MLRILTATRDGLRAFDQRGRGDDAVQLDRHVTAVVRDDVQLWAIVDSAELWYAPDGEWRQITTLADAEATCLAMTDAIHVGSSGARLFRLTDGELVPVESFDAVEGRDAWYTPWGGPPATRSLSEWGEDVYVNVHVGGVVRTSDGGVTWDPTIDIDADVHQVATAEGLVLAAGALGLWTSTDRGVTWSLRSDGLESVYCRSVVVCADGVLVSASDGPRGGHAGIYRAGLMSGAFERCRAGLPEWFEDNIDTYCLDALNDGSYAAFGTSDGRLYGSENCGQTWTELVSGLPAIQHLLLVPS